MPDIHPAPPRLPGDDDAADEMARTLRRAHEAQRTDAEIAADDQGASAAAETDDAG